MSGYPARQHWAVVIDAPKGALQSFNCLKNLKDGV